MDKKDLFKFNMFVLVNQLRTYFSDADINISFDKPNRNETLIKDYDDTHTHNVYIDMSYNEKYYDCGFDFLEKTFHVNENKYISAQVNLDVYKLFDEDVDNYNDYLENCIYRLLILLCSLFKNEYTLAEILFAKANADDKNIKRQSAIFRKILYEYKNNKFNLRDWYDEIIPINLETGENQSWEEFIEFLNCILIEINYVDINCIQYSDFEKIILEISSDISPKIQFYKMMYIQCNRTLMLSLKTINELIDQISKTKKYIPQYINNFLTNDLLKYHDKEILESVYENLKIYFS